MDMFKYLFDKDAQRVNTLLKDKLFELPPVVAETFKNSGILPKDVLTNWDLFLRCVRSSCKGLSLQIKDGKLTLIEKSRVQNSLKRSQNSDGSDIEETELETANDIELSISRTALSLQGNGGLPLANHDDLFTAREVIYQHNGTLVYVARRISSSNNRDIVAIKVFPIGEKWEKVWNEIDKLRACKHQNILSHELSWINPQTRQVSMVTEYCEMGSVKSLLQNGRFKKEDVIVKILNNVLQGLDYLHSQGFIHRDIKSSNVLITRYGEVKICDFGLCTDNKNPVGIAGSKFWSAPEIILRHSYNQKVDVWSVGALAYEMAEGRAPYREFRSLKSMFLTVTVGAPTPKPRKWSKNFLDFISVCFERDPAIRPSSNHLLTNHPLFTTIIPNEKFIEALRYMMVIQNFSGV